MTNSEKDKTVLVTGGSGFIAVHCILKLLKEGYTVKTTLGSYRKENYRLKFILKSNSLSLIQKLFESKKVVF